jgi:hypothetical protein
MDPARDLEVTWRSSSAGAVGIPTGLRNPEKYCTAPPYWRYNGSELAAWEAVPVGFAGAS